MVILPIAALVVITARVQMAPRHAADEQYRAPHPIRQLRTTFLFCRWLEELQLNSTVPIHVHTVRHKLVLNLHRTACDGCLAHCLLSEIGSGGVDYSRILPRVLHLTRFRQTVVLVAGPWRDGYCHLLRDDVPIP